MPTRVVDLDLDAVPERIAGLAGYDRVFVVLRWHGEPLGSVVLPVRDGTLTARAVRDALAPGVALRFRDQLLRDYLDWDPVDATGTAPRRATVAVCTRERPDDLRRCLRSLLPLAAAGHELLVVDSAPRSDATACVVADHPGVRYIREPRRGLSAARNRAMREAHHEVVAFTDDDAVAEPRWLERLLRNFDDPLVLAVTGLTLPLELETDAQERFERYTPHGRGYDRRVFNGVELNPLRVGDIGAGVNLALRRAVVELLGPFDEALGAGTPTHAGEDYDMFSRIFTAGYRIVYEPSAVVRHLHRRTEAELRATLHGYGVGVLAALTRAALVDREWSAPKIAAGWMLWQLRQLVRGLRGRPGAMPPELLVPQLRGCLIGPWRYLRARRAVPAA